MNRRWVLVGPIDTTEEIFCAAHRLAPSYAREKWHWQDRRKTPSVLQIYDALISYREDLRKDIEKESEFVESGGLRVERFRDKGFLLYANWKLSCDMSPLNSRDQSEWRKISSNLDTWNLEHGRI